MAASKPRSDLIVFTGRFGSGKTEVAINYALARAQSPGELALGGRPADGRPAHRVLLIDLDIVTPYFRTREAASALWGRGVEVIAPSAIGRHLDTPAITPQILGGIQQTEVPTVLDVGGDSQGARALGQFSAAIRNRGYKMHLVVNPYRPFTNTLAGLATSIEEIEASARLRVTGLVSNPHMMHETSAEQIGRGHSTIEGFAREIGLPIAFVAIERRWQNNLGPVQPSRPVLVLERFFVPPWEAQPEASTPQRDPVLVRTPETLAP